MNSEKTFKQGSFFITDPLSHELVFASDDIKDFFGGDIIGKKCYTVIPQGLKSPCPFCPVEHLSKITNQLVWRCYDDISDSGFLMYAESIDLKGRHLIVERVGQPILDEDSITKKFSIYSEEERGLISKVLSICSSDSHMAGSRAFHSLLRIIRSFYKAEMVFAAIRNSGKTEVFLPNDALSTFTEKDNQSLTQVTNRIYDSLKGIIAQNSLLTPDIISLYLPKLFKNSTLGLKLKDKDFYALSLPLSESLNSEGLLFIINPVNKPTSSPFLEQIRNNTAFSYMQSLTTLASGSSSLFDSLSGVKNSYALSEAKKNLTLNPPRSVGIIFLDINGLKYTNDHFGHASGDALISEAGKILRKYIGENNCYRMGGDEFVCILKDIPEETFGLMYDAVRRAFSTSVTTSASVGCSYNSGEDIQIQSLISEADKFMYQAKDIYYEMAKRHPEINDHSYLNYFRHEVAKALVDEKIDYVLSPYYMEPEHYVVGANANMIIKGSIGGIVNKNELLDEMEAAGAGLMVYMNMFKRICQYQRKMLDKYKTTVMISITVGFQAVMFSGFGYHLAQIADFYKIPHEFLGVRFSSVRHNSEKELKELNNLLLHLGFKTFLNNFGAGEANIDTIGNIRFSSLLLSPLFLPSLENKRGNMVIIGLKELIDSLGIPVYIDGIEDEGTYSLARKLGFMYFHGPYLSEDLSKEKFEEKYYKNANPNDKSGLKDWDILK